MSVFTAILTCPTKPDLITCAFYFANSYWSNDLFLKTKINFIRSLFQQNRYPTSFMLNVIDRFIYLNITTNLPTTRGKKANLSPCRIPNALAIHVLALVNALPLCFYAGLALLSTVPTKLIK